MNNTPNTSAAETHTLIELQTSHEMTPGLEERIDAIVTESNQRIEQNQGFNAAAMKQIEPTSTTIKLQTSHEITSELEERVTALVDESNQRMQ